MVTAGAQIEPDTKPGASFQLSPASTATVSAISSNLTPIAGNDTSPPSPGSCDCQCFCPLSAFPMLNGLPTVRSMPIVQNSTFLKLASPVTLDQMRSSTVYSKGISAVTIALQETGTTPSSPIVVSAMPAVSVVTTSLAGNSQTFDSATTPTSASTPQPNADNSPIFNIDTYSLFKSVAVPVVARDLETPVAKLAGG